MNILSLVQSSAAVAPAGSALGLPLASAVAGASGSGVSAVPSRDSAVADLSLLTSSMNALAGAASAQTASSADSAGIELPPLPAMPAPAPAPAVPTDDHGQSNIVFSDADSDGSLIH